MHDLESIIAAHPFFKELSARHLQLVTGCASNVRFDAGKYIFREGEPADSFYVIREGQVALELFAPGHGAITIQTLDDGDVIGWSWLIPPYRWHFAARAMTTTRALAFDGKCLRDKCEADRDFGYEFLKRFTRIMTERLEATRLQLLDMYGAHA